LHCCLTFSICSADHGSTKKRKVPGSELSDSSEEGSSVDDETFEGSPKRPNTRMYTRQPSEGGVAGSSSSSSSFVASHTRAAGAFNSKASAVEKKTGKFATTPQKINKDAHARAAAD